MILIPMIDIDNLILSKIEPLWSLMTKGEKNKDISDMGRDMTKQGDQLKFEYTSRGSMLMDLVDAFKCAFTYACLYLLSLNSIYMLMWCMLVVGLNDKMKN
jgi:hypothetical protein